MFPLVGMLAAWRFGTKGGFIVCFFTGVVILSGVFINSRFPNLILDIGDIALGTVLCWLVGRQGELKLRLMETATELENNSLKLRSEVNERKRAEEQYKLIADHTADIIYKASIKEEKFNYISPSVERILGYSQAEAMNIKLAELLQADSNRKQIAELAAASQNKTT